MRFETAIDAFIADWKGYGQINSQHTERSYREKLAVHAEDCGGRPVEKTGRADVKRTLARWEHANTKLQAHSILTSFYDWCCEENIRDTNPARQVRRARRKQPLHKRLTRQETEQLLAWARDDATFTERWAIYLGICAGLRCQELCLLEVPAVMRRGWVHVERSAGKGQKERWVPVISDLQPIIEEIAAVGPRDGHVLRPKMRASLPAQDEWVDRPDGFSRMGMYRLVKRCGLKAGLHQPVTPHTLRHAFGDFTAKYAGLRVAQALLGHASVETTAGTYVDRVSLDEMTVALQGFTFFSPQDSEKDPGVWVSETTNTAQGENDVR